MKRHLLIIFLFSACSFLTGCDLDMQGIVATAATKAVKKLHPKKLVVILADSKTGEILAMTSMRDGTKDSPNDAICWMFEPGSTYKPVVTAAALNERVVDKKTLINCEQGKFPYGGKIIRDYIAYAELTPPDILQKSSNIGACKMALLLKDDVFYDYERRFGFGTRTGIDFPGEKAGIVNPPSKWDSLTKVRNAFGQSVAVTPIQLTMAYCAIANGGKWITPWYVEANKKSPKPRKIISPETASIIRKALEAAVTEQGTAPLAQVAGLAVAGKQGTSQAVDSEGNYIEGKHITSFAGYFPAQKPRYVCVVVVDRPRVPAEQNYGGLVAAPIFAEIAKQVAIAKHLIPSIVSQTPTKQTP